MIINPVEVIRRKRDGLNLQPTEIDAFISGAVKGLIPEYQTTAFLMATFFRGMNLQETTALTRSMIQSGRQVHFGDSKPKIDKHSTGGVGDKISLILAPLVACLGVDVPMVSGRGLGHTGGTLDKLEAIPGFKVKWTIEEFVNLVARHDLAMMGQSDDFVPADKLLYALRDVTATVECIPLIAASILSKKAAEGISGLVLDIKVGSGAFMKTQRDAERLARTLVTVARGLNLHVRAVLTDMNQPLGLTVGNSLEVLECLDVLNGKGPSDVKAITIELAAHMLILGGRASSIAAARTMAHKALQNGTARSKFREMCKAQGATSDVFKNPDVLCVSPHTAEVKAPRSGYVNRIDGQAMGLLVARIGGGRLKTTDTIDAGVGLKLHSKIGSSVKKQDSLATVYYNPEKLRSMEMSVDDVTEELAKAYLIGARRSGTPLLIKKVIK